MKKTTIKIMSATMLLLTTFASCQKGDTGAAGANGTNGTNGVDGNANVKSATITVTNSNWTYNSSAWEYYCVLNNPTITQSIVDNGMVYGFIQSSTGIWRALPATINYSTTQSYTYTYTYYLGGVTLFIDMSDNSTFTTIADVTFKFVQIDGAIRKAHPNTDWNNYEQVKAALSNEIIETTLTPATLKH